jgi:hypothetical protein
MAISISRRRFAACAVLALTGAGNLMPLVVHAETDDEVTLLRAAQLDNVAGVNAALAVAPTRTHAIVLAKRR